MISKCLDDDLLDLDKPFPASKLEGMAWDSYNIFVAEGILAGEHNVSCKQTGRVFLSLYSGQVRNVLVRI